METITERREISEIINSLSRVRFKQFCILNTPWATDKDGLHDPNNLALFVEFADHFNKRLFWLISETEFKMLVETFRCVRDHNITKDSQGREFMAYNTDANVKTLDKFNGEKNGSI